MPRPRSSASRRTTSATRCVTAPRSPSWPSRTVSPSRPSSTLSSPRRTNASTTSSRTAASTPTKPPNGSPRPPSASPPSSTKASPTDPSECLRAGVSGVRGLCAHPSPQGAAATIDRHDDRVHRPFEVDRRVVLRRCAGRTIRLRRRRRRDHCREQRPRVCGALGGRRSRVPTAAQGWRRRIGPCRSRGARPRPDEQDRVRLDG